MQAGYETVIGLEIHVELATKTKIFCGCSTKFGQAPNQNTCPVCTGMPGALPVLNEKVVEMAIAVGLACGCKIRSICRFDRKNYFYPDNPQNYQISQLYFPICYEGRIPISFHDQNKEIRIREIHMEEDAGKLIHTEKDSYVDYNRSGVPLLEIVTEPDFRSAEEVIAFLEQLKLMLQYLGVSDCKMQEGSMRADVNLSVKKKEHKELGTRTEMKNLSSFKAIAKAVEVEANRQIQLLEQGKIIEMETRRWDEKQEVSYSMRSKESSRDYRYFPEPDLFPLKISESLVQRVKEQQPEFPREKAFRYQKEYDLPAYDAGILTKSLSLSRMFEETTELCGKPKKVSNWLLGETMRLLKEQGREDTKLLFTPRQLAALIQMIDAGRITGTVAKEVFEAMFLHQEDPESYVRIHGLESVQDQDLLRDTVKKVIEENEKSVIDYRKGKRQALGFFIGQTMKRLKGQADPETIGGLLKEILDSPSEIV